LFPVIFFILSFLIITYLGGKGIITYTRFEIYARYILAFPGAIMSYFGFYLYYQSEADKFKGIKIKNYFIYSSAFFLIYAIFGGLVVPVDDFFPASIINYHSVLFIFGVPVQVFRALGAVGISWSIWHILNVFNIEEIAERKQAEKKNKGPGRPS